MWSDTFSDGPSAGEMAVGQEIGTQNGTLGKGNTDSSLGFYVFFDPYPNDVSECVCVCLVLCWDCKAYNILLGVFGGRCLINMFLGPQMI